MNYWDSSAILPLLVAESTTQAAMAFLAAEPTMVTWWGTPVECVSALMRVEREGTLDPAGTSAALRQLGRLQAAWHEVQPLHPVRQTAQRLLRMHALRAADALQLAAALVACEGRPESHCFVCLDARLNLAAQREGFHIEGFADSGDAG